MAAFSCQFHPFLFESIFLPNTPIKTSGFMDEESCSFSLFDPPEPIQQIPVDVGIQKSSCDLNHSSKGVLSDNEPSVTKKKRIESDKRISMDKKGKNRKGTSLDSEEPKDGKKQKKSNGAQKDEVKKIRKVPEEPPTGFIHVRARRGEATDSHSLAERVRREKISERMKMLQRLVPGCDKVTGKALMLDEIINYVQALQNQVEFLSMKLASLNPMYDFGMDLDSFIVSPERLSSMESVPQQSLAQCSPIQGTTTAFADATPATIFPTPNIYPLLDSSAPLVLQHGQRPNAFSQDNGSSLWDVEDQMQKFLSPSGFTNNLFSFQ